MTKKRSRKEKTKAPVEEENGIDSQDEPKSDEETASEPVEPKKKKAEKRKYTKKSKKEVPVEEDEEEENEEEEVDDVQEENDSNEDDDDAQYEVEEIIDEKMIRGVRHFLIRWKGYGQDGDTWEPESTVDCPELVKKFKEHRSNDENETPKRGRKPKNTAADADGAKRGRKEKSSKKSKQHKDEDKPKKKAKSRNVPEVDWESDDEFEVDRILDVYFKKNGQREFLVSWKGYPQSQDSWEPEENLDCVDLIQRYMNKVEKAKSVEQKELRLNRTPTERFTLNMYSGDASRRLSRRLGKKQRVQYHEAE